MKKILSFDGGGIRGIISLLFLHEIEKATKINLSDHTDLFAGTSTGAITAGSLAAGLSTAELLHFYETQSHLIFSSKKPLLDHLPFEAKYSNKGLLSALEESYRACGVDPNIKLGDMKKKILIPAIDLKSTKQKRWQLESFDNLTAKNRELSLIDVIMRSTAAPTYFPSYQGYIDGGIGANDPSALALANYHAHFPSPVPSMAMLSFGTGFTDHSVPKGEDWGALSWIVDFSEKKRATTDTPLISVLFDVQEQLAANISALFLGKNFRRIDLQLTTSIRLDDAAKIPDLIEMTKKDIVQRKEFFEESSFWVKRFFSS